jgi:hypothetical protein
MPTRVSEWLKYMTDNTGPVPSCLFDAAFEFPSVMLLHCMRESELILAPVVQLLAN